MPLSMYVCSRFFRPVRGSVFVMMPPRSLQTRARHCLAFTCLCLQAAGTRGMQLELRVHTRRSAPGDEATPDCVESLQGHFEKGRSREVLRRMPLATSALCTFGPVLACSWSSASS